MSLKLFFFLTLVKVTACYETIEKVDLSQKDKSEIPFEKDLFLIDRPPPSTPGEILTFKCRLPDGHIVNDKCHFVTPSNRNLFYTINDETKVYYDDDVQNAIPGIKGNPDSATCGLEIQNSTKVFFGEWTCILNTDSTNYSGHFAILDESEGLFVKDVRLPSHVIPDHYDLDLFPFIEEGNFTTSGKLKLYFRIVQSDLGDSGLYRKIYLHSKDIAIHEDSLRIFVDGNQTEEIDVQALEFDYERDFLIIVTSQPMPFDAEKRLVLEMSFTSYLNDYLVGFYRSSYVDQTTNQTKFLAVTQFESHFARLAFPCLDEPDKKATFTISLTRHSDMVALSNMDFEKEENTTFPDYKKITFRKSVKMSTYLVAFLVSDFNSTESPQNSAFKIWHQKSKEKQASLAANNGYQVLTFYEMFFNISYPLPKTDMAAIPDFSAGAMENWGLVTYRETLLLYEDGISDANDKETILQVIAHELAHQWFGNLVTMKWWTDLWLNEGFATYTQYHGMDAVFNESRSRDRILLEDVQNVFSLDALENSAALSQEVTNPAYDAEFGAIAYSKGCSILRMAEHFLSLSTFKKGVSNYLSSRQYSNAERDDLWSSLTEAALEDNRLPYGLTVKDIMDGWTLQPGYPVVTVEDTSDNFIKITQKRFYLNEYVESPANTTWTIPINVAYPNHEELGSFNQTLPTNWLFASFPSTELEISEKPYIMNIQETGYYRVNYDDKNWNDIINILKQSPEKIHELNRAQLIDDSLNLARAGQLDYKTALDLTTYLTNEFEFIPWQSALNGFYFLELMFDDPTLSTEYEYLQQYIIHLLTPLYDQYGFDQIPGDSHLDILNRKSTLKSLCSFNHTECVQKSRDLFSIWMQNPTNNSISPDLREVVYRTAIRHGGEKEWNFMWEQFLTATIDSERLKLIYALGMSQVENCIEKYLNESLSENIRLQDVVYVYRGIGLTSPGREFQFHWLESNWEVIKQNFQGRFDEYLFNLVSGYAAAANTVDEIKKLEDFLERRRPELESSISSIERSIDRAMLNLRWMEEKKSIVVEWLKATLAESDPNFASKLSSDLNVLLCFLITMLALHFF